MKSDYYINYMNYYIPETYKDAEYIVRNISDRRKGLSADFEKTVNDFLKESRIDKVAYFRDKREFIRMAYELIEKMLQETNVDTKKISYILCGNQHLFDVEKISLIQSIKNDFNFSESMILPIMQPCATALCGINIAEKLLDDEQYILIITGCCWNDDDERYIDFSIRGDGIGLVLLSRNKGQFVVTASNALNYNNSIKNADGTLKYEKSMGRFNLICTGSRFLINSLEKFNLDIDDITRVIQPNTGYFVFHDLYSYYTKIPPEKFFFDNIQIGGHICDVDIIRNLVDFDTKVSLDKGDKIVLYTPDVEINFDINYHSVLLQKC